MRVADRALVAAILLLAVNQSPAPGQNTVDPDRQILSEIKEAYKAPYEVHEDVLKELRRSYQQPSLAREAKIFQELRRLYVISPEQEQGILQEIRLAYQKPSPEQEERIFQEIRRAERLPEGTVPASVQTDQAGRIFRKLDVNGDGQLSTAEAPDSLRTAWTRWDDNRDGTLDLREFRAYYQGRLSTLSAQVAAGQIDLGLKRGGPILIAAARNDEEDSRPNVPRAGNLPAGLPSWFAQLDSDGDGQIGLYEWKTSGWTLDEFVRIDRNGDGFLTITEVLRATSQQQPPEEQLTPIGRSER